MNLSNLAVAANTSLEGLAAISYSPKGGKSDVRLIGQGVSWRDLRFSKPQICPDCIIESQFIQAHFELSVMVACPLHEVMLVSSCPECEEPLSWLRPGLLECHCGADLSGSNRQPISEPMRDLLDVIRRKVLGLTIPDEYGTGIPAKNLGMMQLRALLQTIQILGRHSPLGLISSCDDYAKLSRAAHALSNWPHNLFARLGEFEQLSWRRTGALLTKGVLAPIYGAVRFLVQREDKALFLQDALSEFAKSRRGPGGHTPETPTSDPVMPNRPVSKTHFAQNNGISIKKLDRLILEGKVEVSCVRQGRRQRYWIDPGIAVPQKTAGGRVYGVSKAADLIGIQGRVLSDLKASGVFAVIHLPDGSRGYHARDIEEFSRSLKSRAQKPRSDEDLIPLSKATRYPRCTIPMRAEMIRRILGGEIPVFGRRDTTVQQLQVARQCVISFAREILTREIMNQWGKGVKHPTDSLLFIREAAQVIGCSQKVIPLLVERKHLNGTWKGNVLWVDRDSIDRFQETYVRIACTAKAIDSNPQSLIETCRKIKIPMIICKLKGKDGTQVFILRQHEAKVRQQHLMGTNRNSQT